MSVARIGVAALVSMAALGSASGSAFGTAIETAIDTAIGSAIGSAPRTSVRHEVQMRAISFAPAELVVSVGDTIEWRNADIVRHSAVRLGVFESGELRSSEHYAWVPSDTGTFTYRCSIHSRMKGKIVVR